MDSMDKQKVPGIMAKLKNSKGFSLIEMAIVLVIIGIIVAAIIKGQDLILNSQAKKVVATSQQWRNLAMAFYDRNGRFPGDENKNGIIGDQTAGAPIVEEQTAATAATAEIVGVMEQTPDNPLTLGSTSLYIYLGNVTTTSSGARNAIVICGDVACDNVLTADQVELIKAVDTAIDGFADGGLGAFRSITADLALLPGDAPTLVSSRYSATFTAGVPTDASIGGGTLPWSVTYRGAVWLFDKTF